MGIFSRLFGSKNRSDFDAQEEADKLLKELPPCTDFVVIASPRYSSAYRAEVIADAGTLADFLEKISGSSFGGSHSDQVARVAMPIWLRAGEKQSGSGFSYLPTSFFNRLAIYVEDFVSRGEAVVHCPNCNAVVSGVKMNRLNSQSTALHSEWTSEWRCPENHLLYKEDHEILWMRRPVAEPVQMSTFNLCSDLASKAAIEVVLSNGKFSAFFIAIVSSGDEFINAIKDREALQKFVRIIEMRIKHKDFEDPYANYKNLGLPEPTRNMDVPRVVVDKDEKQLAHWTPEKP